MIKSYNKITLNDLQSDNDIEVEINWREDDPATNECKVLKFHLANSKFAYIKREEFIALALALGSREEKRNLIPTRETRTRWYETTLGVKAAKDIQKGQMIIFNVKIPLPDEREVVWGKTERLPNEVSKKLPEGLVVPKTGLIIK